MRRLIQPALALAVVAMFAGAPAINVACVFLCTPAPPHNAETASPSSAHPAGTHHAAHHSVAQMHDRDLADTVEPLAEHTCNDPRSSQQGAVIAPAREDDLMAPAGPELAWVGGECVVTGRDGDGHRPSPDVASRALHPLIARRI